MKNISYLFLLFFLKPAFGLTQICKDLPQFVNGRTLIYETYDAKGKPSLEQTQTVTAVFGSNENQLSATVMSSLKNEKGKEISSAEFKILCSDEGFSMDMQMMIPGETQNAYKGMEAKVVGGNLLFPSQMSVGQSLPDGKVEVEYFNSGSRMAKVAVELIERKVESVEEVTVASGSYLAYKISAKSRVMTETMIMPLRIEFTTLTWFDQKAGIVRTESVRSNGKPDGYTVLKAIR